MTTPFQTASGDPAADRRADYAEMLAGSGDHAAAAEVMLGALELAPAWALGWFRLGELHEAAGAAAAAVEAWRMALKLDPDDHAGATLKLALAGATSAGAMPAAFVETLFDHYAPGFDAALVETLQYRAPQLLFDAIVATGRERFDHAVDLGCGTGLMGERLRPIVGALTGIDISAGMLRKAAARRVYDRLEKADLASLRPAGIGADLVVAADVFMYVGALEGVAGLAASMLVPGGVFAFSVESHVGPEPFVLRETRRYAHAQKYVRETLQAAGCGILAAAEAAIRKDRGEAVAGLIVVARKGPAG